MHVVEPRWGHSPTQRLAFVVMRSQGRLWERQEILNGSPLRTQGPIRRGRRSGAHCETAYLSKRQRSSADAERRRTRVIDGSRGMGPCVRRDDVVTDRHSRTHPNPARPVADAATRGGCVSVREEIGSAKTAFAGPLRCTAKVLGRKRKYSCHPLSHPRAAARISYGLAAPVRLSCRPARIIWLRVLWKRCCCRSRHATSS